MSTLNYFGSNEAASQARFADFRTRLSLPLLRVLAPLGVTANHLTLASALCGLFFGLGVVLKVQESWIFLGLHLLFDSLDGSMARFRGECTRMGSLYDIITDHVAMLVICAALPLVSPNPWSFCALYTLSYCVMVGLLVYGNDIGVKNNFVLRTKWPFFGLATLNCWWALDTLIDWSLLAFSCINILVGFVALVRIHRHYRRD